KPGENRALRLEGCTAVIECLSRLDAGLEPSDQGHWPTDTDAIFARLKPFGEPARDELLARAAGPHGGWRNLSSALLSEWGGWTEAHLPRVIAAENMHPGGWMARVLGEIGSDAAIEALVADLDKVQQSQIEFALAKIGPRAI